MKKHNKNTAARIALWDRGLTQGQFARKIGMGYTTLNQILNGRIRPRSDEKEKIARGLGVAVEKIFPG